MNKSKIITVIISILLISLITMFYYTNTQTPERVLERFIANYYFDQGSYKDYKKLFINEERIMDEDEYIKYRENNNAKDLFPVDHDSVESVMKHLKKNEISKSNVEFYWIADTNSDDISKAKFYWIIEKKGLKWYMK